MLIEQIVELQLRGSGPPGLTCTSISGYFHAGPARGGSGGISYPGPDLGGPGLGGTEELRLSRQVLDQQDQI